MISPLNFKISSAKNKILKFKKGQNAPLKTTYQRFHLPILGIR
jgi:hypothetical protein